jgi:D-alanyl-lipoteichoic acid acyltransferase DltB (MBOAT superfamily)
MQEFLQSLFQYNHSSPMFFNKAEFWLFFGLVVIVYQFLYDRTFWRNNFILAFSLFFYYKSSGLYMIILLFSIVLDYFVALYLFKSEVQWKRKMVLVISIIANLGLLAYFKYTNFVLENIYYLASWDFKKLDILLPIGISFYTFQTISYVVDVYKREITPCNDFLDYAFYMAFFPHLVAGPIVRASDFKEQIHLPYQVSREEYGIAIYMILGGLVKKIFISDYLSQNFVDRVFTDPTRYSGFENLIASYGYALQIYCDFSGYTDIAIGIALLLGFRLKLNFNSPYISTSITDFWRRWHISLSSWLRDYLYIALGGNRHGKFRTYLNLMITMLLGGLWHGAHFRFIIWGALHGVALAIHKLYQDYIIKSKAEPTGFRKFLGQFITFHFVCFCWLYFRAKDVDTVNAMLYQMCFSFQWQAVAQMLVGYKEILGMMVLGFTLHWIPRSFKDELAHFFGAMPDLAKAVVITLIILVISQVQTGVVPFIYFDF